MGYFRKLVPKQRDAAGTLRCVCRAQGVVRAYSRGAGLRLGTGTGFPKQRNGA